MPCSEERAALHGAGHVRAFTPMEFGMVAYCTACRVMWPCPAVEGQQ